MIFWGGFPLQYSRLQPRPLRGVLRRQLFAISWSLPQVFAQPNLTPLTFLRPLRARGANNIAVISRHKPHPHSHRGSQSAHAIRNGERCSGRLSAISKRKRTTMVPARGSEHYFLPRISLIHTNIFFGKPKNFCTSSPFVPIGYAELKVCVIRGCIFCSQRTARTMLSHVVCVVVKYRRFLPKFNALKVFKNLRARGQTTLRKFRPQRGHIYVAAIAAVEKRWRSFCCGMKWSLQKL